MYATPSLQLPILQIKLIILGRSKDARELDPGPADALLLLGRAQMNYTLYILRDAVSFATSTNMLYEDRSISLLNRYLSDVLHVLYAIYPMH